MVWMCSWFTSAALRRFVLGGRLALSFGGTGARVIYVERVGCYFANCDSDSVVRSAFAFPSDVESPRDVPELSPVPRDLRQLVVSFAESRWLGVALDAEESWFARGLRGAT